MSKKDVEFSIALIGAKGIGKSSLVVRYALGTYDEEERYDPTIEDTWKHELSIDGYNVKLLITDMGDPDEFGNLVSAALKSADGVMFCYNLSDPDSLMKLETYVIEFFKNEHEMLSKLIKDPYMNGDAFTVNSYLPIVLVGTKADLVSPDLAGLSSLQTAMFAENIIMLHPDAKGNVKYNYSNNSKRSVLNLSNASGIYCIEVSAKQNSNVQDCFEKLVRQLLKWSEYAASYGEGPIAGSGRSRGAEKEANRRQSLRKSLSRGISNIIGNRLSIKR